MKREELSLLLRSEEQFDSCLWLRPLECLFWEVLLGSKLVDKTRVSGRGAIHIFTTVGRWRGGGKVWRARRGVLSAGNVLVLLFT